MRLSTLARFLGVKMVWERKGPSRNWWGLFLHGVGGAAIVFFLFFDRSAPETFGHLRGIVSILWAIGAGVAWEVVAWRLFGWPGNGLDIYPWGVGATAAVMAILAGLGF